VEVLNQYLALAGEAILEEEGTLDKFMGDAVMAIFNAPIALEAPSLAAVYTAVELSQGFEKLQSNWLGKATVFKQLGLGIGVSRGEVFHGNVGSSRRLDYTVIGTDVNIAQRLAATTKSGQILITDSVYEDVKGAFSVREEADRELRGVEKKVKLYSIEADSVELPDTKVV